MSLVDSSTFSSLLGLLYGQKVGNADEIDEYHEDAEVLEELSVFCDSDVLSLISLEADETVFWSVLDISTELKASAKLHSNSPGIDS